MKPYRKLSNEKDTSEHSDTAHNRSSASDRVSDRVSERVSDRVSERVSEAVKEKTVDEVMEIIGVGKFQYFVFLICGISFMADAVEVSLLSFLAECLEVQWALSDVQKSALTSIVFVGQLFGSYFWGPFADKKVIVRGVCVCVCVMCV